MENLNENKITDLEIRLTHQEAALEEMNGVLLEQHKLIDSLQDELERLRRQLQDINAGDVTDQANEPPPPHY